MKAPFNGYQVMVSGSWSFNSTITLFLGKKSIHLNPGTENSEDIEALYGHVPKRGQRLTVKLQQVKVELGSSANPNQTVVAALCLPSGKCSIATVDSLNDRVVLARVLGGLATTLKRGNLKSDRKLMAVFHGQT